MTNRTTYSADTLPAELRPAVMELLYQFADDELTVGHRASEWLGLVPHIEEDVALSSIAQDEVGHAALYYRLLHELGEQEADHLAYGRDASARRNATLVEQPNGDWAQTIARGYAYNVFDALRLQAACQSTYEPLAQAATKILREEKYHLLHFSTWFRRLATTTSEARERLTAACGVVWPAVGSLFSPGHVGDALHASGIWPVSMASLQDAWLAEVSAVCTELGLPVPDVAYSGPDGRRGDHTPDLTAMLDTMTEVYRLDPAANW